MELFQQNKRGRSAEREETKQAEDAGTDPVLLAAAGSVLFSWYQFYVRGDAARGVFVGLWPPTILAFASYYKQTDMSDRMDRIRRMM
ncbi:hypothetical protein [Halomarina ordinaria]|uniref:Uncharacterized protein n=1 Tax=Halomarina ordinaria TaxID=3033939 RepID=A0ABD5U9H6_9EURY|nr:hypothetical protein [Halomarina sp. PSRA2]